MWESLTYENKKKNIKKFNPSQSVNFINIRFGKTIQDGWLWKQLFNMEAYIK
jgi:hypothetical protein